MNPTRIRAAIAEALAQRPAFEGVTIERYPRPADSSNSKALMFGGIPSGDSELVDFAGSSTVEDYEISMALWWGRAGGSDDDFAEAETRAVAMFNDFNAWLDEIGHGKRLTLPGVVVDDMALVEWSLGFRITNVTEAEIQFTLAISEVIT